MPLPVFQLPQYGGAIDGTTASLLQSGANADMQDVQNFGQFQQNYVQATNQSAQSLIQGTNNLGQSMAQMGEFIYNAQQQQHVQSEAAMLAPIKQAASAEALRRLSAGDQNGWNFLASAAGIGAQNPILARMNDSIMDAGKAANTSFVTQALTTQKQLFDAQQQTEQLSSEEKRTAMEVEGSAANNDARVSASQADTQARVQGAQELLKSKQDFINNSRAKFMQGAADDGAALPTDDAPADPSQTTPNTGKPDLLPPASTGGQPPLNGSPAQQQMQQQDTTIQDTSGQTDGDPEANGGQGSDNSPIKFTLDQAFDPATKLTPNQRLEAVQSSPNASVIPVSSQLDSTIGGRLVVVSPKEKIPMKKELSPSGGFSASYILNDNNLTDTQKAIRAGMQKVDTSVSQLAGVSDLSEGFQKYGGLGSGNITATDVGEGTTAQTQFYGTRPLTDKSGTPLTDADGNTITVSEPIGKPVSKKYGDLFADFQDGESQVESNFGHVSLIAGAGNKTHNLPVPKDVQPYASTLADILSRKDDKTGKPLFTTAAAIGLIQDNLKKQSDGTSVLMPSGQDAINAAIDKKKPASDKAASKEAPISGDLASITSTPAKNIDSERASNISAASDKRTKAAAQAEIDTVNEIIKNGGIRERTGIRKLTPSEAKDLDQRRKAAIAILQS